MTELERSIVDAIARAKAEGLEPTSIYLRPGQIEELGGIATCGGLPVKRISEKGRPRIYTRHGVARAIAATKPPPRSHEETLVLVCLLQGWALGPWLVAERRLREQGLVGVRTAGRRHKGRTHQIEEPLLTGTGEEAAQRIWNRLSRPERAALREAAWGAGR
jgi:hypothetical protein